MRAKIIIISLMVLFSVNLWSQSQQSCTDCHKDLIGKATKHAPLEDGCETCHEPNGQPHPKDFVKAFTLAAEGAELCYMCHDAKNTKTNVHAAMEDGDCVMCHNPHSSDNHGLLKEFPTSNLCYSCHDAEEHKETTKHKPFSDGACESCHDAHHSEHASLLIDSEDKVCLKCHDSKFERSNFKSIHAPFEEACINCHKPHASGFEKLLTEKQPALCYNCHESKTEKANVHAALEDGECTTCHTAHVSKNQFLLTDTPENTCANCHDLEMPEKDFKHQPVTEGKCFNCHDSHQSDHSHLLKNEMPALCFQCHVQPAKEMKMANIHPPFDGGCTDCHKGHNSKNEALLVNKTPDLCYECHDDVKTNITEAKIQHQAITEDKNCMNCHSAHATKEEKLLIAQEKELCSKCHNHKIVQRNKTNIDIDKLLKTSKHIHTAIETEGCKVCHYPHGSANIALLTAKHPTWEYTEAKEENFELCFTCHDSGLMTEEKTTTATEFRDGDKNMHFLHINGRKGRNCNLCHNMHAADNEKLITNKTYFGKWLMPVEFKFDEKGGSCKTGCHAEKKYKR